MCIERKHFDVFEEKHTSFIEMEMYRNTHKQKITLATRN